MVPILIIIARVVAFNLDKWWHVSAVGFGFIEAVYAYFIERSLYTYVYIRNSCVHTWYTGEVTWIYIMLKDDILKPKGQIACDKFEAVIITQSVNADKVTLLRIWISKSECGIVIKVYY